METAKVFENGRSQAIRLPKQFRFNDNEVLIQKVGEIVILIPKALQWQTFYNGLQTFTDDCFQDGRAEDIKTERETL